MVRKFILPRYEQSRLYPQYTVECLPLFAAVDKGVDVMAGTCKIRLSSSDSWEIVQRCGATMLISLIECDSGAI
jgi:hypothetical protein